MASQLEKLRELASSIRSGNPIDWQREADAQAIDLIAGDAEYAERIGKLWEERLAYDDSPRDEETPEGNIV